MSRTERIPTRLGLPLSAVLGLALLGVPRAVAHDLGPVGRIPNALLVFVPVAVWLGVVLWRRVPNAFLTLLAVGLAYGVLLGLTHQVLWACALDTPPPRIGGTVEGVLPPAAEAIVLRLFAFAGSLVTGLGVGALTGAVARLVARTAPSFGPRQGRTPVAPPRSDRSRAWAMPRRSSL